MQKGLNCRWSLIKENNEIKYVLYYMLLLICICLQKVEALFKYASIEKVFSVP